MPITKIDLTRILVYLKQARHLLNSGREIAAKAEEEPLNTILTERVAAVDGDIHHVDALRSHDGT